MKLRDRRLRKTTDEVKGQETEEKNGRGQRTGVCGRRRVKSRDRRLRKETAEVKGQEFEKRDG